MFLGKVVLKKVVQIYRRAPMPKCGFNKVTHVLSLFFQVILVLRVKPRKSLSITFIVGVIDMSVLPFLHLLDSFKNYQKFVQINFCNLSWKFKARSLFFINHLKNYGSGLVSTVKINLLPSGHRS